MSLHLAVRLEKITFIHRSDDQAVFLKTMLLTLIKNLLSFDFPTEEFTGNKDALTTKLFGLIFFGRQNQSEKKRPSDFFASISYDFSSNSAGSTDLGRYNKQTYKFESNKSDDIQIQTMQIKKCMNTKGS